MANSTLSNAKAAKKDEFYTMFYDIETEMEAYLDYNPNVFRGKTVLLPCDDPEWSNFTKYFAQNFEDTLMIRSRELGRLYSTHLESLLAKADNFYSELSGTPAKERIRFPEINRPVHSKSADRFQPPGIRTVRDIRQAEVYFPDPRVRF